MIVVDHTLPVIFTREFRVHDIRRIAAVACVLLVTLRLFIGWQFFYEGMWKYQTMGTANEWTAEGYLANAQGPFRDTYRNMVGDPDGLNWLDYDKVAAKWDNYAKRFASFYNLDEGQRAKLDQLVNGVGQVTVPLSTLPEGVVWPKEAKSSTGKSLASVVKWDGKQLIASTDEPVKPSEIEWAKSQVKLTKTANGQYAYTDDDGNTNVNADANKVGAPKEEIEYFKALERLEQETSRGLGYKKRARASLIGDPDRKGVTAVLRDNNTYAPEMKTTKAKEESVEQDSIVYGEIQVYKDLLKEYDDYLKGDQIAFRQDHAAKIAIKVREKKAEVVTPIIDLDKQLRTDAGNMLTSVQLAKGALPDNSELKIHSNRAMYGLLILGTLLMLGLLTRVAALAGAIMLLSFYMVLPPWPGVPEAPGPEHSFIVNKNLIEVVALLAIAAMPTGTWFGLDGIFYRLFSKSKKQETVAAN